MIEVGLEIKGISSAIGDHIKQSGHAASLNPTLVGEGANLPPSRFSLITLLGRYL